ncbi:GntR family transcriptional regulator [Allosphingosinicella indica]|uniref:Regulatory protein, gntR family n=1 Tax=Allosphingosinicella indica TaxID=941907 RepID=A0A1X7FYE3_9SPHN|nr:GntR family transcriptional regulator [Allosphingosinicella indica]SMF61046.1 regulatory protein, gntR family [Allosphingosinicella indica]
MSPGAIFERVYLALRDELRSGRHPPGAHLEPAALADALNASITPVRDALHRLVGERLVEAPRGDGFRTPMITEMGLRHLYDWIAALLRSAIPHGGLTADDPGAGGPETPADWLRAIAAVAANPEQRAAIEQLLDRLAPYAPAERNVLGTADEAEAQTWRDAAVAVSPVPLRRAIAEHFRRRRRAAHLVVAALHALASDPP